MIMFDKEVPELPAICSKLNKYCKGHPVQSWIWLKNTYGPIAHGIQDACTAIYR
jgi:hypothetical protein